MKIYLNLIVRFNWTNTDRSKCRQLETSEKGTERKGGANQREEHVEKQE